MIALLLAALTACPLINGGIMTYPTINPTAPWGYRVYVENPSDRDEYVSEIEVVLRQSERKVYYDDDITLGNIKVPKRSSIAINLMERPEIDPTLLVGAHIDCF